MTFKLFEHEPCPTCGGLVFGRRDKIFCALPCKNKHHSIARKQLKSRSNQSNKRIRRNATLLEGILGPKENAMTIHRDELIKRGFDIESCTKASLKGSHVVYELYGYRYYIRHDGYVIVKRNVKVSTFLPGFHERYLIEYPRNEKGTKKCPNNKKLKRICRNNE